MPLLLLLALGCEPNATTPPKPDPEPRAPECEALELDPLASACGEECVVCEAPDVFYAGQDLSRFVGCDLLVGDLLAFGVPDLSVFSDVVQIDGTLTLSEGARLSDFGSLARVGGLSIQGNTTGGFEQLSVVDGTLSVSEVVQLPDLDAVQWVGSLDLADVRGDLSNLGCLSHIEESLSLFDVPDAPELGFQLDHPLRSLSIVQAGELAGLDGLVLAPEMVRVDLFENERLAAAAPLATVERIEEDLLIESCPDLEVVDLSALVEVDGELRLSDLGVSELTLDALTSVVTLTLVDLDLQDLAGLSSLQTVGNALTVGKHDDLLSVDGLLSLDSVGGRLWVYDNSALESLDGLTSLTEVGSLDILDNPYLVQLPSCRWPR